MLTDINKLAAQARRFLTKTPRPTSSATPRSPASSHPGTPPSGLGGGSVTSPLISPRRSEEEGEQTPSQSRSLSRNNSTGLGSRNLAGPFGAAAAQGQPSLQLHSHPCIHSSLHSFNHACNPLFTAATIYEIARRHK